MATKSIVVARPALARVSTRRLVSLFSNATPVWRRLAELPADLSLGRFLAGTRLFERAAASLPSSASRAMSSPSMVAFRSRQTVSNAFSHRLFIAAGTPRLISAILSQAAGVKTPASISPTIRSRWPIYSVASIAERAASS